MKLSYGMSELNETTRALSETLFNAVILANVTFREAQETLAETQRLIEAKTSTSLNE